MKLVWVDGWAKGERHTYGLQRAKNRHDGTLHSVIYRITGSADRANETEPVESVAAARRQAQALEDGFSGGSNG